MNNAAALKAAYSDWKLVKTRGVVQIVLEIPIEAAGQAYDVLGGMPNPASEVWVGVARLKPESEVMPDSRLRLAPCGPEQASADKTTAAPLVPRGARPGKRWDELSPAQQAGIRCGEVAFWRFLNEELQYVIESADDAAEAVRDQCGVKSRREIKVNTIAGETWNDINSSFLRWMHEPEFA